jgi:hypothetical protein
MRDFIAPIAVEAPVRWTPPVSKARKVAVRVREYCWHDECQSWATEGGSCRKHATLDA